MKEKIIKIEKLDHQGRGIGKIDEKVVFIPYTLPLDEVKYQIIKEKKNFCEAIVTEYVHKSSKHIVSDCQYYQICGGCDLKHMRYDEQLKFKENKIREIIKKFSDIENETIKSIIPSDSENHYRNKLTLKANQKLCMNKKNAHDYVVIDECKLVNPKINSIIKILNKYDLNALDSIVIKCAYFTNDIMVVFNVKKGCKFNISLDEIQKRVSSIIIKSNNKIINTIGKGNIFEKLGDLTFKISSTSFFQVNSKQTLKLYDLVLEKCKLRGNEIVYDLYCGTGTIGIYLSNYCQKVIGIEINEESIRDAIENVQINNISNCEFYSMNVAEFMRISKVVPDVIIVDPPRSGLDNMTIMNIIKMNPQKIIYVSCDPVTLARDLNLFKKSYNICDITPVDMFPQTCHVECVSVLHRKSFEK